MASKIYGNGGDRIAICGSDLAEVIAKLPLQPDTLSPNSILRPIADSLPSIQLKGKALRIGEGHCIYPNCTFQSNKILLTVFHQRPMITCPGWGSCDSSRHHSHSAPIYQESRQVSTQLVLEGTKSCSEKQDGLRSNSPH